MPVTHEQLALIRWSYGRVQERIEPASIYFYEALFRIRPDLRSLFRDDLAGQGMKFMTTLGVLIEGLTSPAAMSERVVGLGETHRQLGIDRGMYAAMEEALIDTIRHVNGGNLAEDVEAAWRAAYREIGAAMVSGKGQDGEA